MPPVATSGRGRHGGQVMRGPAGGLYSSIERGPETGRLESAAALAMGDITAA
jgi:hypothetical protein